MGRPRKLQRRVEFALFPNILEYVDPKAQDVRGRWREVVFHNEHPLILELACGKGDYTTGLAEMFPQKNFLGIDIKSDRMWRGAKKALERNLTNAFFFRSYIDHLTTYVAPGEVDEIWITFPDPHPTNKGMRKRLTNSRFLAMYQEILKPCGLVHLKTDDEQLFHYSVASVKEYNGHIVSAVLDLYHVEPVDPQLLIQTAYEKRHRAAGKKIFYLAFTLPVLTPATNR